MANEMMEALEAAWPEDDDLTLEGARDEPEDEGTPAVHESSEGEVADESGELLDSGPEDAVSPDGDTPDVHADQEQNEEQPSEGKQGGAAPVSWNATAREAWKDIPKAAQDYIQQREQQMQQGMQKNAEMARRAEGMDRTLQPYQQYFAMNGGPGQTLKTLLETGSHLQMGSPHQKAQVVANIIQQYGVDIASLDHMLTGESPPAEVQQQHAVQQQIQQAIAPYQQHMQQMEQQRQQQYQQVQYEAGGELQQFAQDPKNEFYNDLRGDMADILDMASNRGIKMGLQEAYDRAVALNPEISKIVQGRVSQTAIGNKRRAASSVTGGPGGAGGGSGAQSMHDAISAAWEGAGRG